MSAPRTPRERVPYSAIVDRAPLKLPGGARMVVWSVVNVEDWGIERPMPRTVLPPPMGQPLLPDLPNWAWHEYGMRVGFWRLFECMQKFKITPTLAINGLVCRTYPRVAQAAKDAGWEFMAHGWLQAPMHKVEDQRAAIRDTIEATRPVVSIPYSLEINDIAMMVIQNHPAEEMLRRGKDHFDRLYEESAASSRVMAIAVHPYISGVPHRIRYLEELYRHILAKPGVVHWTGGAIMDWYRAAVPAR